MSNYNFRRKHCEKLSKIHTEPNGMSFGNAIKLMKDGYLMARKGWNGKEIFIAIQEPDDSNSKMTGAYIYIDTTGLQTDNDEAPKCIVPWLPSQTDMLSNDWHIVLK